MDITTFWSGTVDKTETEDNGNIKKFFNDALNNRYINIAEYDYCINHTLSECKLKNSSVLHDTLAKIKNMEIPKEIVIQTADQLVEQMKNEREKIISFNDERMIAIKQIFDMIIDCKQKIFGLFGYAGSGKTTLIMELVLFLVTHKLIHSIVFSAPTHKALNVMKTNFSKLLNVLLEHFNIQQTNSFENNLRGLLSANVRIEFSTIHRLLDYSMEFSNTGEKIFTKKSTGKNAKNLNLDKYDLIIIDECSMIPLQIIIELFNEIQKYNDDNKIPKIMFSGDPAQLPPVNEKKSSIFTKHESEFSLESYLQNAPRTNTLITDEYLESEYKKVMKQIMEMKTVTLKQIFRNNRSNVLGLCDNIRKWVSDDVKTLSLGNYGGNGVYFYKCNEKNKTDRTKTKWFKKCVEKFKAGETSNVILTWTNQSSELYNNTVRKILTGKDDIGKYEIGDVLILNDFYMFQDENDDNNTQQLTRFYTSEQLKITGLEECDFTVKTLKIDIPVSIKSLSCANDLIKQCRLVTNKINRMTTKTYHIWKMTVLRLGSDVDMENKTATINVIHDTSSKQLNDDAEFVCKTLKYFTDYCSSTYPKQMKTIEKYLLKLFWIYYDTNYISPFANVIFGYSITTHKAQGSTFYNVFIDAVDIFKNTNETETKRCIYTAHTRCANEVHILI